jgi:hypothetical protein
LAAGDWKEESTPAQPSTGCASDDRRSSVQCRPLNSHDELLAQAVNLLIARGAYREAARMYLDELIELRQDAGDREEQRRATSSESALLHQNRCPRVPTAVSTASI